MLLYPACQKLKEQFCLMALQNLKLMETPASIPATDRQVPVPARLPLPEALTPPRKSAFQKLKGIRFKPSLYLKTHSIVNRLPPHHIKSDGQDVSAQLCLADTKLCQRAPASTRTHALTCTHARMHAHEHVHTQQLSEETNLKPLGSHHSGREAGRFEANP